MVSLGAKNGRIRDVDDPFYGGQFVVEESAAEGQWHLNREVPPDGDSPFTRVGRRTGQKVRWAQDSSLGRTASSPNSSPLGNSCASLSAAVSGPSKESTLRTRLALVFRTIFIFSIVTISTVFSITIVFYVRPDLRDTAVHHFNARAPSLAHILPHSHTIDTPAPLPTQITQQIDIAVRHATAHQVSRRDYALDEGVYISPGLTSNTRQQPSPSDSHPAHPANVILRPNLNGGPCWELDGVSGQVGIILPQFIYPSHITVDHIPRDLAEDPGQAPRRMTLWGVVDGQSNLARYDEYLFQVAQTNTNPDASVAPPIAREFNFVRLADIRYDIESTSYVQTFPVDKRSREMHLCFGVYVLELLDNWGSNVTCLYRVRIHGSRR